MSRRLKSRVVLSPIRAIEDLVLYDLPNRKPVGAQAAIRVNDVLIVIGDGRLYWPTPNFGRFRCGGDDGIAYAPGQWPWTDDLMEALAKLDIIAPELADYHARWCAEKARHKQAVADLEYVPKQMRDAGLEPTPEQMAALESAAVAREVPKP